MKHDGMRGFTLYELLTVIAISGVLMGIAGFSVKVFHDRYAAESQLRQMHADMMSARVQAFQKNRVCFVTVTSNGYQIIEDTNDSGGTGPDAGDTALWPAPKQFKFRSRWDGTVIMDGRGIVSLSTGPPLMASTHAAIRFDSAVIDPEYDCIALGPTRVLVGKWNIDKCTAK